jgi:anthraniloyl-CoA monooxygenase
MLCKKRNPSWDIEVFERNALGETFGWGVVFSDETISYLGEADEKSGKQITDTFAHWDAIDIHFKGALLRSGGHGFSGIARRRLLEILHARALEVGVTIHHKAEVDDIDSLRQCDLLVAADGLNSKIRTRYASVFEPDLDMRRAKYIWLGTKRVFDAFTFLFAEHAGGVFQVHAYRFDHETSTFIVETDPDTWRRAGLDTMAEADQLRFLEGLFSEHLQGHSLLSNRSSWIQFPTLRCKRWSHENIVLMGDAVHTAHFSIGSGTKLAMEDAIALDRALASTSSVQDALRAYEDERRIIVEKTQAAAQDSLLFFENTARYMHFTPEAFGFRLLTRSKKIGYDNLKVRDAAYLETVRQGFAAQSEAEQPKPEPLAREAWLAREDTSRRPAAPPPMFQPFGLRGMTLANRVVVSPMCMYSAVDGVPGDFHLVHYGSRAMGGAGLLFTEMTNVLADGRITPGCTGIYNDAQRDAWRRIVDFVHAHSATKFAMQLGHAGRKGATKLMWDGMDQPLETGAWPLISASALPYYPHSQVPKAMDEGDMVRVKAAYVAAAERARDAGFDMLEVHMAHGYLLASFISPLTNVRTDGYGGGLEARMRYPLEVFKAVRAVWPEGRPMSVRISATDWLEGGITGDDSVHIAQMLKQAGCDLVDVSAGQTTPTSRPPFYGRMYQTPFADQIRNDVRLPTMAVGNISTADQVNTILAAGRADLVAIARGHLREPNFTHHAAEELGYRGLAWPKPYGVVYPGM